jgi:hypothetical protein
MGKFTHFVFGMFWVRKEINLLRETQKIAFTDFYKSARFNNILEPKTTLMLHLAVAMALACYP